MGFVLAKPVQDLIQEFEKLPGIGPKSAARLAFHFLNAPESRAKLLAESLLKVKRDIVNCENCFNISDTDVCAICSDIERDSYEICVVEDPLDVVAIENSNVFKGMYHVLGGVIAPIAGIGPEDIRIGQLQKRVEALHRTGSQKNIEVIIATNPTMEGEATAMYILDSLKNIGNVVVSRIARGMPTGGDIEYADYMTLKKSMENRTSMQ